MTPADAVETEAPEKRGPTILVVEDEVIVRMAFADALRDEGYNVIEAANGGEAREVLQTQFEIDLLITDIRMPGEPDGLALASSARERRSNLKVLISSSHVPADRALVAADLILQKPFRIDELVAAVEKLTGDA